MRKQKHESSREPYNQLDEFEAYGQYSYSYQHDLGQPEEEEDESEYESVDDMDMSRHAQPQRAGRTAFGGEVTRSRKRSAFGRLLFLLVCAAVALVVLQGTVFRLQSVYVVGNKTKTAQHIAQLSGLAKGLNIFSISEEDVRKKLSADHTLEFLGMQKEYPGTIYLYVSERAPVAAFQWLGILYTLDTQGLVMDESNTLNIPEGVPLVTGFQITNIRVGRPLEVKTKAQLNAYIAFIAELSLQLYTDQISELNLSNSDNLYLVTVDGITVRLGDSQHARAKIGALRTDLAYLRQLGKTSGMLDVSIPQDAKYTPEDY